MIGRRRPVDQDLADPDLDPNSGYEFTDDPRRETVQEERRRHGNPDLASWWVAKPKTPCEAVWRSAGGPERLRAWLAESFVLGPARNTLRIRVKMGDHIEIAVFEIGTLYVGDRRVSVVVDPLTHTVYCGREIVGGNTERKGVVKA